MGSETRLRRKRAGVRLDAALVATLVVGVSLIVGAVLLVSLVRSQLTQGVESTISSRAQDLVQLVAAGDIPTPIPSARGVSVQIVTQSEEVLTSTGDIEGQRPVTAVRPNSGEIVILHQASFDQQEISGHDESGEEEGEGEGPFLLAVARVGDSQGLFVIVAASLQSVDSAVGALRTLLIGGIPIVALIVFATTWVLAGRTLKPVTAMRAEAELITVTDLKRRIPLPNSNDEIRDLGETLNHMLDRLEASLLQQQRFVADASHELKSPVASLQTMSEVAATHPDRVNMNDLTRDVGIEARRLSLLVDDLLTIARADEGGFKLKKSRFDLAAVVMEQLTRVIDTDIQIDLKSTKTANVTADRRRVGQVVTNLVDNAISHAESTVWIETRETPNGTELTVADDGPGIPMSERQRVFERFVRLDESRSRFDGGTGLGLAVVKSIVDAHDGNISITDDDRFPGTTTIVLFPG